MCGLKNKNHIRSLSQTNRFSENHSVICSSNYPSTGVRRKQFLNYKGSIRLSFCELEQQHNSVKNVFRRVFRSHFFIDGAQNSKEKIRLSFYQREQQRNLVKNSLRRIFRIVFFSEKIDS